MADPVIVPLDTNNSNSSSSSITTSTTNSNDSQSICPYSMYRTRRMSPSAVATTTTLAPQLYSSSHTNTNNNNRLQSNHLLHAHSQNPPLNNGEYNPFCVTHFVFLISCILMPNIFLEFLGDYRVNQSRDVWPSHDGKNIFVIILWFFCISAFISCVHKNKLFHKHWNVWKIW